MKTVENLKDVMPIFRHWTPEIKRHSGKNLH